MHERQLTLFLALILLLTNFVAASDAAMITVTSTADTITSDSDCTLREAIIAANADTVATSGCATDGTSFGADTIEFDSSLALPITITLTGAANEGLAATGDLDITDDLAITGRGMANTIIDANSVDRIFEIISGAGVITIQDMTLMNGDSTSNGGGAADGGAIRVIDTADTLILNRVMITKNTSAGDRGGGVYTDGHLNITDSTIVENDANDGGGLYVDSMGDLTMDNTIIGPMNSASIEGGGILSHGAMVISNSVITGNTSANDGGGLAIETSSTTTIITDTEISDNVASSDGGGIFSTSLAGSVTISRCTISGNDTAGAGGGLSHSNASLTITGSTISGNTSTFEGGGVYNSDDVISFTNVTISGNDSGYDGGGIFNATATGTVNLTNATITQNTADSEGGGPASGNGGGIANIPGGTINADNTIIAGNTDASPNLADQEPDCSGTLDTQGSNLIEDTTGCTGNPNFNADIIGQDPLLGLLVNNGGTTLTHALLANSPATDVGRNVNCPLTDQRGLNRADGACDIGAYEVGSCGDGFAEPTEECDDGGESASCDADCTVASCGNGMVNTAAGEMCDDGNTTNGDGCSDSCQDEVPVDPGTAPELGGGGCSLIRRVP